MRENHVFLARCAVYSFMLLSQLMDILCHETLPNRKHHTTLLVTLIKEIELLVDLESMVFGFVV